MAVGSGLTQIPFTAAVGYGEATALTRAAIADTSSIDAMGNVTIDSDASAIAAVAHVRMPSCPAVQRPSVPNVSVAFAYAATDLDSTATLAEGASIESRVGNANIQAKGQVTNNPAAWTAQYGDGTGGIAVALGFDDSDVETQVDGTVKAAGQIVGSLDPQQPGVVDLTADTIRIENHGFSTGDQVVYAAGTAPSAEAGTPIGGLAEQGHYTVLVVDDNHIQLARSGHLDLNNSSVQDGAVHSLTPFDVKTFAPVTPGVVNHDTDTIRIESHGFTQGQLITYAADGAFEKNFEPSSSGAVDPAADTITISSHGFVDGEHVVYLSNDGDEVPGLEDGKTYEVELDSLPIGEETHKLKLVDPDTDLIVDLSSGDQPEGIHRLSRHIYGHPIQGLQPGEQYVVDFTGVADSLNEFQLKLHGEPVDILPQNSESPLSAGVHYFGFEHEQRAVSFVAKTGVDNDQNTVRFTENHSFETGDAIVYRTDPTKQLMDQLVPGNTFELKSFEPSAGAVDEAHDAITIEQHQLVNGERVFYDSNSFGEVPGLVDGKEYEVDLDSLAPGDRSDKLKLIDPDDGTVVNLQSSTQIEGTHSLLKKSVSDSLVNMADLPVAGLEDAQIYNVVVVDSTTIRLTESHPDALAAVPIDLTDTGAGTEHALSRGLSEGIGITATLDATNKAFGGPAVGGNPTWRDLRWNPELLPSVKKLMPWSGLDFAKDNKLGGQNSSTISIAGGVGLLQFEHDVTATAGKMADLESGADITIEATTDQKAQIRASASITKPSDAEGTKGMGAGAVALGFYDNNVQAVIAGDGLQARKWTQHKP